MIRSPIRNGDVCDVVCDDVCALLAGAREGAGIIIGNASSLSVLVGADGGTKLELSAGVHVCADVDVDVGVSTGVGVSTTGVGTSTGVGESSTTLCTTASCTTGAGACNGNFEGDKLKPFSATVGTTAVVLIVASTFFFNVVRGDVVGLLIPFCDKRRTIELLLEAADFLGLAAVALAVA